ncbi:MAG: hypothetical protein ABIH23_30930, partial [bacterium]
MNTDYLQSVLSTTTSIAVIAAIVGGYALMRSFLRMRESEKGREYDLRAIELGRKSSEGYVSAVDEPIVDPSGYILINLPEDQKSMFMDLLKGFEDYATLKGYRISFSYDGSLPNRVAFRFTIIQGGVTVSTERVRQDIQEYIRKVENGEDFDDLDIVVPLEQHHIVLMMLKNRLAFLQQTYATQRNAIHLYEKLIKTFNTAGIAQPAQFFIQGGGTISPTSYSAINSRQIAQGQHLKLIGNSGDQVISIGNTFNERKEIVELIEKIERSLWTETDENKSKARELRGYLEKARDEICDEPQPDE